MHHLLTYSMSRTRNLYVADRSRLSAWTDRNALLNIWTSLFTTGGSRKLKTQTNNLNKQTYVQYTNKG